MKGLYKVFLTHFHCQILVLGEKKTLLFIKQKIITECYRGRSHENRVLPLGV